MESREAEPWQTFRVHLGWQFHLYTSKTGTEPAVFGEQFWINLGNLGSESP
jgi:hypothetical protein